MIQDKTLEKSWNDLLTNRLHSYANILLVNGSFVDTPGLINGKMGIPNFCCHYSRYMNFKVFEDYADELTEEINPETPLYIENRLTGICWGIEDLLRNRFLAGDTDEILNEIDSFISDTINDLFPGEWSVKAAESECDLYQQTRNNSIKWNERGLISFVKQKNSMENFFSIDVLISSSSYGLFGGIA
jgi:hypothetical protein